MTYGSHLTGIWIAQIDPSTGKRINSTVKNIAGSSSSQHEASYVIRGGSYYYLFYNRGVCCSGVNSTYYVQMGRSTNPNGPYVDKNGVDLLNGGGTTVLSSSGKYIGPGQVGLYQENGSNFLTHHYYDGDNNGAHAIGIANLGWSNGWPYITRDWIAAGTYKVTNVNSGLVWDAWGCTGVAGQSIAQGNYANLSCQKWVFAPIGDGVYKITNSLGGRSVDVNNCGTADGTKIRLMDWFDNDCQKFKIDRTAAGNHIFTPLYSSNQVIEVPSASTTAGVQLGIWTYNGSSCQKWTITAP